MLMDQSKAAPMALCSCRCLSTGRCHNSHGVCLYGLQVHRPAFWDSLFDQPVLVVDDSAGRYAGWRHPGGEGSSEQQQGPRSPMGRAATAARQAPGNDALKVWWHMWGSCPCNSRLPDSIPLGAVRYRRLQCCLLMYQLLLSCCRQAQAQGGKRLLGGQKQGGAMSPSPHMLSSSSMATRVRCYGRCHAHHSKSTCLVGCPPALWARGSCWHSLQLVPLWSCTGAPSDLNVIKGHLQLVYPHLECYCSKANEVWLPVSV
jgi:hypothetical protein